MTYRDIAGATPVFDRHGRCGRAIFDEDPDKLGIDNREGWVAYQPWDPNAAATIANSGIERLSVRTTWDHANEVLGPLYTAGAIYKGPNVPADHPQRDKAADLDVIRARLAAAGLLA